MNDPQDDIDFDKSFNLACTLLSNFAIILWGILLQRCEDPGYRYDINSPSWEPSTTEKDLDWIPPKTERKVFHIMNPYDYWKEYTR